MPVVRRCGTETVGPGVGVGGGRDREREGEGDRVREREADMFVFMGVYVVGCFSLSGSSGDHPGWC